MYFQRTDITAYGSRLFYMKIVQFQWCMSKWLIRLIYTSIHRYGVLRALHREITAIKAVSIPYLEQVLLKQFPSSDLAFANPNSNKLGLNFP